MSFVAYGTFLFVHATFGGVIEAQAAETHAIFLEELSSVFH